MIFNRTVENLKHFPCNESLIISRILDISEIPNWIELLCHQWIYYILSL